MGRISPGGFENVSMSDNEIIEALTPVVDALEVANIRYRVGGSVASSALGVARSTLDVDVACEIREEHVDAFVGRLSSDYYIDADMVRDAIRRRASFNVVHFRTMIKVDVFVQKGDAFSRTSFERATRKPLEDVPGARAFDLTTPEDIILHKLAWYELGGRISERQWSDVLGVMRVQAEVLDWKYLEEWAGALDLAALLSKAKAAAQASP